MHTIALVLPSFWPELHWVLVVLLAEVRTAMLEGHQCSLLYGQIFDVVVFGSYSFQKPSRGTVMPCDFTLEVININQLLQVLMSDIRVRLDD